MQAEGGMTVANSTRCGWEGLPHNMAWTLLSSINQAHLHTSLASQNAVLTCPGCHMRPPALPLPHHIAWTLASTCKAPLRPNPPAHSPGLPRTHLPAQTHGLERAPARWHPAQHTQYPMHEGAQKVLGFTDQESENMEQQRNNSLRQ